MSPPESHPYDLRLLGGFELRHQGRAVDLPTPARRLLAYLALHRRSTARAFVAAALWPDTTDAKAAASLRTALWRLRELPETAVVVSNGALRLSEAVDVDVHRLVALAAVLRDGGCVDECGIDPSGIVGELLPDIWDDWLVFERERLRQISLHALEVLSRRLSSACHHDLAILAGIAAVEADPLRETANRVLVEAHLGEGNVAEAVRHAHRYRDLLRRELGVDPHPSFLRLVDAPRA